MLLLVVLLTFCCCRTFFTLSFSLFFYVFHFGLFFFVVCFVARLGTFRSFSPKENGCVCVRAFLSCFFSSMASDCVWDWVRVGVGVLILVFCMFCVCMCACVFFCLKSVNGAFLLVL